MAWDKQINRGTDIQTERQSEREKTPLTGREISRSTKAVIEFHPELRGKTWLTRGSALWKSNSETNTDRQTDR